MGAVSNAVAERERTPEVSPTNAIQQVLVRFKPVIAKLLAPTSIGEETFVAQIANACRANPELWHCRPESLLGAALRCAQLGLAPNDVRNLAWIIPYGGNATFQLGYGGVMELARRASPGLKFDGQPVYPNDEFDVDLGRAEPLVHRPHYVRRLPRGGDAYVWWIRARYADGTEQIHALDREGVEYHRSFSKQPDGPMWSKSYDAAALKSVILDMRRFLPSSAQLVAALSADETAADPDEIEPLAPDALPSRGGSVSAADDPETAGAESTRSRSAPASSRRSRSAPVPPPPERDPEPEWQRSLADEEDLDRLADREPDR